MDLLIPPPPALGNHAIQLAKAGAKVGEDDQERWLFRGLTLSLNPAQCTGVVGRNGVGKTTLLRICLGERRLDEGTVKIGKRVVFNYIDQARMQLDGTGTVLEEISEGNETVLFGDCTPGKYYCGGGNAFRDPVTDVDYRHLGGSFSAVFCDGHAETRTTTTKLDWDASQ